MITDNRTSPVDVTQHLAELVMTTWNRPRTDDEALIAKCALLDWTGVTVAGYGSDIVRSLAAAIGARTPSRSEAPHTIARLLATSGHVLDYDDVLSPIGHPGNTVFPAALAVSASVGVSGTALIDSIVAAIEVEARIGDLLGEEHYARGFHSTATIGIFGAAVVAALLSGADRDDVVASIRLAALSAAGLKSAFGSWGKSLQVGHAVSEGVLAGSLVRSGAVLERDTFAGPQGFLDTHLGQADLGRLRSPSESALAELIFKYHASCFGTHSAIDGALTLVPPGDLENLVAVELHISPKHVGMCDLPHASTALEAKFSLAYAVAIALRFRAVDLETLTDATVGEPEVRRLASKISLHVDRGGSFSRTRVVARFADGTTKEANVDSFQAARGRDIAEVQWPRLIDKARSLLTPWLRPVDQEALLAAIGDLEAMESIEQLADTMLDQLGDSSIGAKESHV
ncbi:2-methylcitrate dehydratase PrpD [Tamaricihabitans halophyticus]|uniref:2-methylcitrate dehydratase PrpD n=1 Tax=Tamaricihabitans halophyticus TaxID=1262583 RepID=A0A4R2Q8B3_9PSEU|nr:MmgE/PrpD family protein [Tamaricihabitans halophyticus]TCP45047.1 2-methylcitrate dehydratase PrpD [Tamaricihabitans halophyticus]